MCSVILSWGAAGRAGTGSRSKRQGKRGEWQRGQAGVPGSLVTLPAIPRGSRLRTQTTKTAVAGPRGNAISIPGWSWGRLEPPSPKGSGTRGSSGQEAGLGRTAHREPQGQWPKGKGHGAPTASPGTEVGQGCETRTTPVQLGPRRAGRQAAETGPPLQSLPRHRPRTGTDRRGLGCHPLGLGSPSSPRLTALHHRHRRASAPPSAPPGPHAKPPGPRAGPPAGRQLRLVPRRARDWASGVCDSLPGAPLATPLRLG